jgi:cleavage and polyadenylation specificity factor subunit 3
MRYIALGNTSDIGASCHYLNLDGVGIVLDAGVDPEQDGRASLPDLRLVRHRGDRPVDHILISHAHHDHLGSLPIVAADHPQAGIHMTAPTRHLAELLLPSSARLQRRKMFEGSTTEQPLFDVETAEALSYLYEEHDLGEDFPLASRRGGSVNARFYHAGHTLGSAGIHLEAKRDGQPFRVFYTSDTHLRSQVILPAGEYPDPPIDVLLLESTLGADEITETTTRLGEETRLGEAIARVIARGGSVLIPSFALGRAQEVLALIDRYKEQGLIPAETPVYTAGQMRAVADLYDRTRFTSPRVDSDFEVFGVRQARTPRSDEILRQTLDEPCIHVASSGMMFERTLSHALAQMMVEDERHGIFFVGFCVEHSPGARLLAAAELGEGAEIVLDTTNGAEPRKIRAEVQRLRFSGHAHRRELIELVEMMKPRQIVLVHGETAAKEWMREEIQRLYPDIVVHAPARGEELALEPVIAG